MAAIVKQQPWLKDEQRTLEAVVVSTGVLTEEGGGYVEVIDRPRRGPIVLVAGSWGLAAFELKTFPSTYAASLHYKALARSRVTMGEALMGRPGAGFVITRGDYSYVVGGGGLFVVDVSGLDRPDASMALVSESGRLHHVYGKHMVRTGIGGQGELSTGPTDGGDEAAAIRGDVLFVVGGRGLATFDISDPTKLPTKLGGCLTGVATRAGGAHCLAHASEPVLYVVGGFGLATIDVSDPSNPEPLVVDGPAPLQQPWMKDASTGQSQKTTVLLTGAATIRGNEGMEIVGDDLYLSGGEGVACFDISNPRNPVRRFHVKTGVETRSGGACIAHAEGVVYVIGGLGLAAIDVRATPPRLVAKTSAVVVTREGGGDVKYYVDPEDGAGKLVIAGGGGLRVLTADHAAWAPYDGERGVMQPGDCCTIL